MPAKEVDITQILALILSKLDINFGKISKDIEVRKKIQKSIYLLQLPKYNFDLGYRYNLYLAGPYSPELSDDYYVITENDVHYEQVIQSYRFDKNSEKKLREFSNLFKNNYDLLESIATLHFLNNVTFAYIRKKKKREEKIKDFFVRIKPKYRNKDKIIKKSITIISGLS